VPETVLRKIPSRPVLSRVTAVRFIPVDAKACASD
jgi:hypothetical protein